MSIEEYTFGGDLIVFVKNRSGLKYNLMLRKEVPKKRNMNMNTEKKKNFDIGWREKYRNRSRWHQIRTSDEL